MISDLKVTEKGNYILLRQMEAGEVNEEALQSKRVSKLFKRNALYKIGRDRNLAQEWLSFEVNKHKTAEVVPE